MKKSLKLCMFVAVMLPPIVSSAQSVGSVNGVLPTTQVAQSISSTQKMKPQGTDGVQLAVFETVRAPGTRTPIHLHPSGGVTCVLKGQMTLYLEGAKPQTAQAGECYLMPAGLPMIGSNEGKTEAVMLDIFSVTPNVPVWEVVEDGHEKVQDQFSEYAHKH